MLIYRSQLLYIKTLTPYICAYMEAALLTLAFDPVRKTFPSEELEDFCLNKQVHGIDSHFFQHEQIPYWTILVRFDRLAPEAHSLKNLTPMEREAFEKLRIWRKEQAETEGYPAYLIATNAQLIFMIKKRVRSLASMDGIKGFGMNSYFAHLAQFDTRNLRLHLIEQLSDTYPT